MRPICNRYPLVKQACLCLSALLNLVGSSEPQRPAPGHPENWRARFARRRLGERLASHLTSPPPSPAARPMKGAARSAARGVDTAEAACLDTECALWKPALVERAAYTINDLARIAGAKPRSVQHWSASGIIRPFPGTDRRGTGTPREFSRDEAVLCCILQPLLERQTPVGELRWIADSIRRSLLCEENRATLDKILGGERGWFVYPDSEILLGNDTRKFADVFRKGPRAIVWSPADGNFRRPSPVRTIIDLAAALKGLRSR